MSSSSTLAVDVGSRNFAICVLENKTHKLLHIEVVALFETKRIPSPPILCASIIRFFDKLDLALWNVNNVVIEQQMTRKMTNIAHIVLTYFIMKGIKTRFVKATGKFKVKGMEHSVNNTDTYAKRKNLAVEYVSVYFTKTNERWKTWFNALKKKDDVCDALLLCMKEVGVNITDSPVLSDSDDDDDDEMIIDQNSGGPVEIVNSSDNFPLAPISVKKSVVEL